MAMCNVPARPQATTIGQRPEVVLGPTSQIQLTRPVRLGLFGDRPAACRWTRLVENRDRAPHATRKHPRGQRRLAASLHWRSQSHKTDSRTGRRRQHQRHRAGCDEASNPSHRTHLPAEELQSCPTSSGEASRPSSGCFRLRRSRKLRRLRRVAQWLLRTGLEDY